MKNIKNILFDLGGVFIEVDYHKTKTAFETLGIKDFDRYFMQHQASDLFAGFEKGAFSGEDFFEAFRKDTNTTYSDSELAAAWNAMLGNFRQKSVEHLLYLRTKYRLFLYSNTNIVHHAYFSKSFRELFGQPLEAFFEKVYYSHELQQRKPDTAGFLQILQENGLDPGETLFVDDTNVNIAAAQSLGMQTLLLSAPMQVEDIDL